VSSGLSECLAPRSSTEHVIASGWTSACCMSRVICQARGMSMRVTASFTMEL